MADYLLDSDIIIELLRDNENAVDHVAGLYGSGAVFHYSPVNVAEIHHGMRAGEEERVRAFFDRIVCVPLTRTMGEKAGAYLQRFYGSHGVRLGDALLAATAAEHALRLLTLNVRHYPMSDLTVETLP